ncbi:MAG: hydrogenase 4 subunit B [Deltaproteobacteria bacterium]|nr:hydrogenase 4 subunit B [Deltaproteobacteria bacterium]
MTPTPLELVIFSVFILLAIALFSPVLAKRQEALISVSFTAAAVASLISLWAGITSVMGLAETAVIPIGLPDLPFYIRLDALSGFFITVISLLALFVSIYSLGYVRGFLGKRSVTSLVVFYCLFMAGMLLVALADDAFFFLISWELMAAASFFLVAFEDERTENRRAAFIYLLIAHVGAIFILLSFGVIAGFTSGFESFNGYTFSAMRGSNLPPLWASVAFLLAFFGFAAKAGMIPLHVWLPEAHPAAPSNVSALMSGVMLKTAIYGIIRIAFDMLHVSQWWWGGLVLALGAISAVMGILYALMERDLKRLLAYSSVENIGIILIGIGLSMIFASFGKPLMSALALTAALYHTLNHAMFKGLLFMGAGAILHSTHERDMEGMGGLIHRMPWTAAVFLVGCVSISALPPFNGFVSEWLTFQAFLLSPVLPSALLKLLIPGGAALLALTAALAAACFVKAYGVVFLGHWRGRENPNIHEVGWAMRCGMILAGLACLFLGVLPTVVIGWMGAIPERLVGAKAASASGQLNWMWLTPVSAERASYSAPIVFAGILSVVAIAYLMLHARRSAIRRAPLWDCGFEKTTNRMQYTAASFSMPIRRIFGFLFMVKETARTSDGRYSYAFPQRPVIYRLKIRDRIWNSLYRPVADGSFFIARRAGKLQHGRIQIYLLYSFVTMIFLLLVFS